MSSKLTGAIIKTLCYSNIFDYPLKLSEIHKFLIGYRTNLSALAEEIKKIKIIKQKNGYYFFAEKNKIIRLRLQKEKISKSKLIYAEKYANYLFFIPSVKLIVITGSLALFSSVKNDDIDFLIITSKNRIWLTRFFCVLFLKILGVYRRPMSKTAPDKICINMFLDENHLSLPLTERDLYSAHEIVQAKTLLARNGYKNILLNANPWVKKYLPNVSVIPSVAEESRANARNTLSAFLDLFENLLKSFQLFYMRKKRTTEIIRNGYLRFHPKDARKHILEEYQKHIDKFLKQVYRDYLNADKLPDIL